MDAGVHAVTGVEWLEDMCGNARLCNGCHSNAFLPCQDLWHSPYTSTCPLFPFLGLAMHWDTPRATLIQALALGPRTTGGAFSYDVIWIHQQTHRRSYSKTLTYICNGYSHYLFFVCFHFLIKTHLTAASGVRCLNWLQTFVLHCPEESVLEHSGVPKQCHSEVSPLTPLKQTFSPYSWLKTPLLTDTLVRPVSVSLRLNPSQTLSFHNRVGQTQSPVSI